MRGTPPKHLIPCADCALLEGAGQRQPPHSRLSAFERPPPVLGVYPRERVTVFACAACRSTWFRVENSDHPDEGGWWADSE